MLPKSQDLERQEPNTPEIAPPEAKKPANLSANAVPKDAMAAGTKLKQTYPVIKVANYDAAARTYEPVELYEPERAASRR